MSSSNTRKEARALPSFDVFLHSTDPSARASRDSPLLKGTVNSRTVENLQRSNCPLRSPGRFSAWAGTTCLGRDPSVGSDWRILNARSLMTGCVCNSSVDVANVADPTN
jgi:hypothetical protein